jgi:hypothetical protein
MTARIGLVEPRAGLAYCCKTSKSLIDVEDQGRELDDLGWNYDDAVADYDKCGKKENGLLSWQLWNEELFPEGEPGFPRHRKLPEDEWGLNGAKITKKIDEYVKSRQSNRKINHVCI